MKLFFKGYIFFFFFSCITASQTPPRTSAVFASLCLPSHAPLLLTAATVSVSSLPSLVRSSLVQSASPRPRAASIWLACYASPDTASRRPSRGALPGRPGLRSQRLAPTVLPEERDVLYQSAVRENENRKLTFRKMK